MILLVDYDNIPRDIRKNGLSYVVYWILLNLDNSHTISSFKRARIRLYGGWYEETTLTRMAQKLVADINKDFPKIINLPKNGTKIVNVELAYSLEIEPTKHLLRTYRSRTISLYGFYCAHPSIAGCSDPNCPLINVFEFIKKKKCPSPGCKMKPEDLIRKNEQKLIDTMLTSDLIYLSIQNNNKEIYIVSSDDDFWPGIRTALLLGAKIIHIHTKGKKKIFPQYYSGMDSNYKQISF